MDDKIILTYEKALEELHHSVAFELYNNLKKIKVKTNQYVVKHHDPFCNHDFHVFDEKYGYAMATYNICKMCNFGFAEIYPARIPKTKEDEN